MKKALINPIDLIEGFPSVVSVDDTEFPCVPEYYWVDCPDDTQIRMYYKDNKFYACPIPAPLPPTAEDNKARALKKLQNTDWVEIPSVTEVTNTPHLLNYNEFLAFRLQARDRVVNPQAGNLDWIIAPIEQWSN
jgi:hypothetical protein